MQSPYTPYIFKFANDYKIEKKKLKIKSINNYNLCMMNCFNKDNAQDSEICQKNCEIGEPHEKMH